MGIKVKATCSECLTMHVRRLEFGQDDIRCPACGHSMKGFAEGELSEMETVCKKQRNSSLISLVSFTVAAVCFMIWVFSQEPRLTVYPHSPNDDFLMTSGLPGLIVVSLLVSLIFGVLGSTKRYIIEF